MREHDISVGIYDPQGSIESLVKAYLGHSAIVIPSSIDASMQHHNDLTQHLIDKELLLSRSTHLIVAVSDAASV